MAAKASERPPDRKRMFNWSKKDDDVHVVRTRGAPGACEVAVGVGVGDRVGGIRGALSARRARSEAVLGHWLPPVSAG